MNKYFTLCFFLLAALIVSCSKSDDKNAVPLRDYNEQYLKDIDTIDEFIDTHYMTVSPDYDVTFTKITDLTPGTSIRDQDVYPLKFKYVPKHGISGDGYKVYYIKLREGEDKRPSTVDSIHVSYTGNLISLSEFDAAQNPVWFTLDALISGWSEIIPFFKTGTYSTSEGPDPVTFEGYGAGVMFLPSGLAYYANATSGIPSYSSLIFSFKLYELRYRDQDRDGILAKDEVAALGDDPRNYDLDGDGIPNMNDIDDDGDHLLTKEEIVKDPITGIITFPDCDGDGTPDYLDPDGDGDGILDKEDDNVSCP